MKQKPFDEKAADALRQAILNLVRDSPLDEKARFFVVLSTLTAVLEGTLCLGCRRRGCEYVANQWPEVTKLIMQKPGLSPDEAHPELH